MSTPPSQAQDVKDFLFATYDPDDDLIYPNMDWEDLLAETLETNAHDLLSKDQVLSVLFGLINRNRVCEGLWWSFWERGVTQKLLGRLQVLDPDGLG